MIGGLEVRGCKKNGNEELCDYFNNKKNEQEEMEKLSIRNAFRVVKIRSVDNPELGVMEFVYKGHKDDRGGYSHVMRNEHGEGIIPYADMERFEVVENKRTEITLDEFWDAAQMAFNWTSFDPERRGEITIKEHEEELNNDIKNIPEEEKKRYIENYKKKILCVAFRSIKMREFGHNRRCKLQ